jgi:DNA modification methylase
MAATIRTFDTYSGTGTTTTVAAEVSRITGIRLAVIAISEIDKVLRERLQRRQHYTRECSATFATSPRATYHHTI